VVDVIHAVPQISSPTFDWHALAPDIILVATIVAVLIADMLLPERDSWRTSSIAGLGLLAALIPIATLAYITLLLSIDYIGEGDYYQGEYYFLLLVSTFGLSVMASARDLITLFIALETISIPTFILAAYRKHDRKSNEAGVKYYLIGVLSSALMLYGMSLIFGVTGTTLLSDIGAYFQQHGADALVAVAIFLSIVGFAFKVSAVPFHFWAPDTYEGAPTPVAAFLSVASKAGGFVALISIIYFGFLLPNGTVAYVWWPVLWVLAVASMTLGNLAALRQTNIVRLLAYSSVAQGGFMLVPLVAAGIAAANGDMSVAAGAMAAVVVYLLIYGAMNLGAFAVVITLARRTRTADISSYAGLFQTSPGLAVLMTFFLASLAGIPPLAGWFAKFVMFRSIIQAGTGWGIALGIIAAVNSVVAFFYYFRVVTQMWFRQPAEGVERTPVRIPAALGVALALTAAVVLIVGVYPNLFARVGSYAF
jgi:NADH-quinone oxidoreductase subunit N